MDYHTNTFVVNDAAADFGYAGMSAGSTAAIVQALDGNQSSSSSSEYAPSPSLESTSSDESFVPSEEEKDDLEEFLLDFFNDTATTEIYTI